MKWFIFAATLAALSGCERSPETAKLVEKVDTLERVAADLSIANAKLATRVELLETKADTIDERLALVNQVQAQPKSPAALADDQVAALSSAIARCVKTVRSSAPTSLDKQFYETFDAFYNPSNGLVQNNVVYAGGKPAYFLFAKCMTSAGIPLS